MKSKKPILSIESFLHKARKIHKNKYDYSDVVYVKSNIKITIICKLHGKFNQTPNSHLNGAGCPKCGIIKNTKSRSKNNDIFIRQSKKLHGDKYDYSRVNYIRNKTKVCIICPIHNGFLQTPHEHLRGQGCPACGMKQKSISKTYNTTKFVTLSKKVHGNKYNYSNSKYVNGLTKVEIRCPIHGLFFQIPASHINSKNGCPQCGFQRRIDSHRSNRNLFIAGATKIHKNRYDYSLVKYTDSKTKVKIKCNKCLCIFEQTPTNHLHDRGCRNCRQSKGEIKISDFLKRNKIRYIHEKTFGDCYNPRTGIKLRFDFHIPPKNLLIEYDGAQHFMAGCNLGTFITTTDNLNDTKYRDRIKTQYAKRKGIRLLRIKYTQLGKIDEILASVLK